MEFSDLIDGQTYTFKRGDTFKVGVYVPYKDGAGNTRMDKHGQVQIIVPPIEGKNGSNAWSVKPSELELVI